MKIVISLREGKTFETEHASKVNIAAPGVVYVLNSDDLVIYMTPLTSVLGIYYPEHDSRLTRVELV